MKEYKLISADSYIVEPPGVWKDRVPAAYRDRAPHIVNLPEGDAWVAEGADRPLNFGLNQAGGLPPERYSPWVKWENVRKGAYDPAERLKDQDTGGLEAEI